ncbi:MAG TPA: hypothetical protein VIR82_08920 [Bradyrhizobium sp.]
MPTKQMCLFGRISMIAPPSTPAFSRICHEIGVFGNIGLGFCAWGIGGAGADDDTLPGISDPQNQGGAAAVSSVKASVARFDGGHDVARTPAPAAQAVLVTSETVRHFLEANGVNATGGSPDARASVVRVICVRK